MLGCLWCLGFAVSRVVFAGESAVWWVVLVLRGGFGAAGWVGISGFRFFVGWQVRLVVSVVLVGVVWFIEV